MWMPLDDAVEKTESLVIGLHLKPTQSEVEQLQENCQEDGFAFCVTRLPRKNDAPRKDVLSVSMYTWRTSIVGQFPSLSQAPGSLPSKMEGLLQTEWQYALDWALHMTLPAVILPQLPQDLSEVVSYARRVEWAARLCQPSGCKLWVPIQPLNDMNLVFWRMLLQLSRYPSNVGMLLQFESYNSNTSGGAASATAWLTRQLHRLHVAIGSGSVYAVSFRCDQFLTNKKGFPTLSKIHQTMLTYLLRRVGRNIRVLVEGHGPETTRLTDDVVGATRYLPYLQYLDHVRQRNAIRIVLDTNVAQMEQNYLDELQQPLQPLKDHLENQTYDVFEKDPVKYREYRRAIAMALQDRSSHANLVLIVVGAGRGPLVTVALEAYASLPGHQRPKAMRVWAIEKNPSAFRRLESLCRYDKTWQKDVKLVQTDLRHLTAQQIGGRPADIVVSELLGSFGCNELSPECLDGLWTTDAVHSNTISIPSDYTSHVAPVASVKLWQQARVRALFPNQWETDVNGQTKAMETTYVVRTHEASQMMTAQDCWVFAHPSTNSRTTSTNPSETVSSHEHCNNRSVELHFESDPKAGIVQGCGYGGLDKDVAHPLPSTPSTFGNDEVMSAGGASLSSSATAQSAFPWTITGLLGTFTATLYKRQNSNDPEDQVLLSTCPDRFSVGMFSWFPLYFPLEHPIPVPAGASVRVHLWRKVAPGDGVWYEWAVGIWQSPNECVALSPLHNPSGRSSKVAL